MNLHPAAEASMFFPSITIGSFLSDQQKSKFHNDKKIIPSITDGICLLLQGNQKLSLKAELNLEKSIIQINSNDDIKPSLVINYSNERRIWLSEYLSNSHLGSVGILIESIYLNLHEEVKQRWTNLLKQIRQLERYSLPLSESDLAQLANNDEIYQAMIGLIDAIQNVPNHNLETASMTWESEGSHVDLSEIFYSPTQTRQHNPILELLLQRNAAETRVLLIGETGSFKTTTAINYGLTSKHKIIVVDGSPGIEDRDLIGGVFPTESGPSYIDGKLSTAFRSAQNEDTLLIINELSRFNEDHLDLLISVMDTHNPNTLCAAGHETTERSYMLIRPDHPNDLIASCEKLKIIATTNLGENHGGNQRFNDALLRRFNLIVEMPYPDNEARMQIYRKINPRFAQKALNFENEINTAFGEDGLLERKTNPGLIINALNELNSLNEQQILNYLIKPFLAQRDPYGRLEASSAQFITDVFNRNFQLNANS